MEQAAPIGPPAQPPEAPPVEPEAEPPVLPVEVPPRPLEPLDVPAPLELLDTPAAPEVEDVPADTAPFAPVEPEAGVPEAPPDLPPLAETSPEPVPALVELRPPPLLELAARAPAPPEAPAAAIQVAMPELVQLTGAAQRSKQQKRRKGRVFDTRRAYRSLPLERNRHSVGSPPTPGVRVLYTPSGRAWKRSGTYSFVAATVAFTDS